MSDFSSRRESQFPNSLEFRSYEQQKTWVDMYQRNICKANQETKTLKRQIASGSLFWIAAFLYALRLKSYSTFAFLYLAGLFTLAAANTHERNLKELLKRNAQIKILLEDWHKEDRFARYDRVALNEELDRLNKGKPTQDRQGKKRALVAKYRDDHPRKMQRLLSDIVKERTE